MPYAHVRRCTCARLCGEQLYAQLLCGYRDQIHDQAYMVHTLPGWQRAGSHLDYLCKSPFFQFFLSCKVVGLKQIYSFLI